MRIDVALDHRDLDAELAALHVRMQQAGDVLHGLPEIAVASACAGCVFRYRETNGEFYVYVEDRARGVLAGCTVFNRVSGLHREAGRHLRSPHSRYAQAYRGRGLATAVYAWALNAGLCLLSGPRQSAGAYRLWQALARSHELALAQVGGHRLRILRRGADGPGFGDLDTRMLLLRPSWTLEEFARRAQCELASHPDAMRHPPTGRPE